MSKRFCSYKEGLILSEYVEKKLVESVCLEKVVSYGMFKVVVLRYEDSFAAQFLTKSVELF